MTSTQQNPTPDPERVRVSLAIKDNGQGAPSFEANRQVRLILVPAADGKGAPMVQVDGTNWTTDDEGALAIAELLGDVSAAILDKLIAKNEPEPESEEQLSESRRISKYREEFYRRGYTDVEAHNAAVHRVGEENYYRGQLNEAVSTLVKTGMTEEQAREAAATTLALFKLVPPVAPVHPSKGNVPEIDWPKGMEPHVHAAERPDISRFETPQHVRDARAQRKAARFNPRPSGKKERG
jgi:hypothetical protein